MAGGEQCASTRELWSAREVMRQCVGVGRLREFSLCAMLGVGELVTGRLALQSAGTTEMNRCCTRLTGVFQLLVASGSSIHGHGWH